MILVDTSVWIDHLRRNNEQLGALLLREQVLAHPCVVGELALGALRQRTQFLELLETLPAVPEATHHEVLELIEQRRLAGSGLGWVDAHLLASAVIARVPLWTLDQRLARVARSLGAGPDASGS